MIILARQAGRCALCRESLNGVYDIDHTLPLCLSGTNELENLRALCKECHKRETERLATSGCTVGTKNTVESHNPPHLFREVHMAPKPQEVIYGVPWKKKATKHAKAQNVSDLLSQHPVPEISEDSEILGKFKDVFCLDAVKCRLFALTKRSRGLPVFCPLDDWEPFEISKLPEYDFVFIDLGDVRLHKNLFPHTGSRPYAAELCEWLLEHKIITASDCKVGLKASARVMDFEKAVQAIERAADEVDGFWNPRDKEQWKKKGLLSMIGLWNSTIQYSYKLCQSKYQMDAGPNVVRRRQLPDGLFEFTTARELLDLYSMAPWGRVALDIEQLRIAQAFDVLRPYETRFANNFKILGAQVDGVFFAYNGIEPLPRAEILSKYLLSDNTMAFQIKDQDKKTLPINEWRLKERSMKFEYKPHVWDIHMEDDIPNATNGVEIAKLFHKNGGLLITGPAGVGKSYVLRKLRVELQKLEYERQLPMAVRHAAAMLVGGKTISHYVHKYHARGGAPAPGTVVIVDEWSEVQLHTWVELARWALMGVKFILLGDADGQRKPIFDKWAQAMKIKDIRTSRFIHELCGGTRVKLTTYRRGTDHELFRF